MICLTEGCEGKPIARGLCKTCYHRIQKRVKRAQQKEQSQFQQLKKYGQYDNQDSTDGLEDKLQPNDSKWGDFIASGECKPARRYRGLTAAVRRKNAIEAHAFRRQVFPTRQENLAGLLEMGKITQEQYEKGGGE